MGPLTPVNSPPLFLSSSLCFTKSSIQASNFPTDSFVVNELSSARWTFLNPHTQAHTGTLPSHYRSSFDVSHSAFSFYTTQCQFQFPRQPLYQSLEVLPSRVSLMVRRSTKGALFLSLLDIGDEQKAMITN